MNLDQVTYFLAIVEQKNFTHAADQVLISQSSLSKQIKTLENELGVQLFSRCSYKIGLTEAGKAFLPFAKKFTRDYLDMMSHLSSFSNNDKPFVINLGILPILSYPGLINGLANLEYNNQNIRIDLLEREQSELKKMLDRNQVDYALARIDYLSPDDYNFIQLTTEELGVLCPIKHHLSSKKVLSLQDLKDESFILLNSTSSLNKLCMEACNNAGFSPIVNYMSSRHEALLAMVNAGLGLTILPKSLLDTENSKNLRYIPLRENITSTIALIRKKDMNTNKKLSIFENIITKYFKDYFINNTIN